MITCDKCDDNCCKILVVEIESPKTMDDFQDIKWYLYHQGIGVYIDVDDIWNVQFDSQCKHLDENGKCLIYDKRPPVCRKSALEECHKNKKEIKHFFASVEEYEDWLKKNYK